MALAVKPLPTKVVFVSHGWGPAAHEKILDEFIDLLDQRLRSLPANKARTYRVEIWFDRRKVHSRSASFNAQTVPACIASDAMVLMLNDKFYASAACQAEVDCFRDAAGEFQHGRAVKIQLSGRRSDGSAEMASGPAHPELFAPEFPNLLALWSKGDEHQRDDFVTRIRDELLAILDQ